MYILTKEIFYQKNFISITIVIIGDLSLLINCFDIKFMISILRIANKKYFLKY